MIREVLFAVFVKENKHWIYQVYFRKIRIYLFCFFPVVIGLFKKLRRLRKPHILAAAAASNAITHLFTLKVIENLLNNGEINPLLLKIIYLLLTNNIYKIYVEHNFISISLNCSILKAYSGIQGEVMILLVSTSI